MPNSEPCTIGPVIQADNALQASAGSRAARKSPLGCMQVEAATGEPAAYAPAPVLTAEQFTQLCKPAQAPRHPQPSPDTLTPSFVPLAPDEPPGPGMLLGLDAEFVAVSLPDVPVHG